MSTVLPLNTIQTPDAAADDEAPFVPPRWRWVRKHPTLIIGALLLIAVAILSIAAPWIATHDPQDIDPLARMQPPSGEHWFGTDALGRDVFSRAVWGGRVSMIVGAAVAVLATFFGIALGLVSGFVRWADGPIMRRDGRADGHSRHPAGHRAHGGDARQPDDGDHRHHSARDSARGAAGAIAGAQRCASSCSWRQHTR